jgi:hypothetical protein
MMPKRKKKKVKIIEERSQRLGPISSENKIKM